MTPDIYLDANATTQVLPAAAAAAQRVMQETYGNPSSTHCTGIQARQVLSDVRARARRVLDAGEGRVVFVSGATEAIQTAVLSALCDIRERRQRGEPVGGLLLYGATEHKAVPESIAHWNRVLALNLELRAIPVDGRGQHDLAVLQAMAGNAALVCTMAANNETGAISDLDGIAHVLASCAHRPLWLVDGVQALGKLPLDLARRGIDYSAFSGHKLYAPKGTGLLYVREGAPYTPLMVGGGQEGGCRSGTENLAGISALGAVLQVLEDGNTFQPDAELRHMRDRLVDALRDAFPGVVFNTPFAAALPTTINFSVPGFSSKDLLDVFDAANLRVSAGSACSAAKAIPSYVLDAMGFPAWRSASAIRMSFGPAALPAWIDLACQRIRHCGQALGRAAAAPRQTDGAVQIRQVRAEGRSSWMLLDVARRRWLVIDPHPCTLAGIQRELGNLAWPVGAVLATTDSAAAQLARQALLHWIDANGGHADAVLGDTGWPPGETHCALADGTLAHALPVGAGVLVRCQDDGHTAYLLGIAGPAGLGGNDVRHVFVAAAPTPCGPGMPLESLGVVAGDQAIVCSACDDGISFTATLGALRSPATSPELPADASVDGRTLRRFLIEHPQARLIDLREPGEHLAGGPVRLHGHMAQAAALSQIATHLGGWLARRDEPLVFLCRSGARSERAAAWLRRLGHHNAWHLGGGLALQAAQAE